MRRHRFLCTSCALTALFCLVTVCWQGVRGQVAPKRPAELLPADSFVYASWAGTLTRVKEYRQTALHDVIEKTPLGKLIVDTGNQIVASATGGNLPGGSEELLSEVWKYGIVVSVSFFAEDDEPTLIAVFPNGAAPGRNSAVNDALATLTEVSETTAIGGRDVYEGNGIAWWAEGDHVVLTVGSNHQQALAVAAGESKSLDSVPEFRRDLTRMSGDVFRVRTDIEQILNRMVEANAADAATVEALGLDGLKRMLYHVGFDGRVMKSELRLDAPTPRRGLVKMLLDQPAVTFEDLPKLPGTTDGFFLLGLDLPNLVADVVELMQARGEIPKEVIEQQFEAAGQAVGVDIREELLPAFDHRAVIFTAGSGQEQGLPGLGTGFAIKLNDQDTVHRFVTNLLDLIETSSQGQVQISTQKVHGFEMKVIQPPPQQGIPVLPAVTVADNWLVLGVTPAVVESYLATVSGEEPAWSRPDNFAAQRGSLPQQGNWLGWSDPRPTVQSLLAVVPMLAEMMNQTGEEFPLDLSRLPAADEINQFLFDSHVAGTLDEGGLTWAGSSAIPMFSAGSPDSLSVVGVGAAFMLPAVQSAREAARRAQDSNNLKQIGLAMHNYADTYKAFPSEHEPKSKLKPEERISWMAKILPFVEQSALYDQLEIDKAWNSPKNQRVLKNSIPNYLNPSVSEKDDGQGYALSHYAGMGGVGEDAARLPVNHPRAGIFGVNRQTSFADITDGTSNTIAVMDVNQDLQAWGRGEANIRSLTGEPYINGPDGIGGNFRGGANFLFADGSVRFLAETIDPDVLRAMATMAGGEVIGN